MIDYHYDSREAYSQNDLELWLYYSDGQENDSGFEQWLESIDPFCGWVDAMEDKYGNDSLPW
jgi:hypothetical protein